MFARLAFFLVALATQGYSMEEQFAQAMEGMGRGGMSPEDMQQVAGQMGQMKGTGKGMAPPTEGDVQNMQHALGQDLLQRIPQADEGLGAGIWVLIIAGSLLVIGGIVVAILCAKGVIGGGGSETYTESDGEQV